MAGGFDDHWGNLAGRPTRWAYAARRESGRRRSYEGWIKLRLAHSEGRSFLIPDVLIAVGGGRFFLPTFFGPPLLAFNVEPGRHRATFNLDVGHPRTEGRERLEIQIRSEDRVRSYPDGAQLYRCRFEGPRGLASIASGVCRPATEESFELQLYHHTTPANASSIRKSQELWSSAWNLAGTRKLENVAYGYFTTLSTVKNEEDLRTIAMSSSGRIQFQTTSNRMEEEVLSLEVYRDSTRDRTAALSLFVNCELIAPSHLLLHPGIAAEPAYFEVVCPDIVRIGVNPSAILKLAGQTVIVEPHDRKAFGYVVIGDAARIEGLAAPFAEEETREISHIEMLDDKTDLFAFWIEHQNSDQVSGRDVEFRRLEPTS